MVCMSSQHPQLTCRGRDRLIEQQEEIRRRLETAQAEVDQAQSGSGDSEGLMAVEAIGRLNSLKAEGDRIATLLSRAEIVEESNDGSVRVGSVVELDFDGEVETFCFGSLHEEHGDLEILTPTSPIGEAVAGARAGQRVEVVTPSGRYHVTVLTVH